MDVTFTIFLQSFINVDSLAQTIQTSVIVRQQWNDPRLRDIYQSSMCKRQPITIQHAQHIWYPKFSIVNLAHSLSQAEIDATPIILLQNGELFFNYEMTNEITCSFDLLTFPFDQHICYFHVIFLNFDNFFLNETTISFL